MSKDSSLALDRARAPAPPPAPVEPGRTRAVALAEWLGVGAIFVELVLVTAVLVTVL